MWLRDLQDCASMPENRMCSLSVVHGSYNEVNLKYKLWPGIEFYEMSKIWYETGITKITFVFTAHGWIPEAAKFSVYGGAQPEDSIFMSTDSTFHLILLTTPTMLMIEINFTSRHWSQTVLGWWYIAMWRKQSLVCHVLNIISAMCFQLKLVAWCFCLSRLTISLAVCEVQSGYIIHRIVHAFVVYHIVLHRAIAPTPTSQVMAGPVFTSCNDLSK